MKQATKASKLYEPVRKKTVAVKNRGGKYESRHRFRFGKINWYWDIRLWIVPITIAFLISSCGKSDTIAYVEPTVQPAAEAIGFVAEPETTAPADPEKELVVALARFADSVAAGRSNDVKRAVIWVAINRSEDQSHGYGLSLMEELARPKQWQQYNPNGNYLESTYNLAQEIVNTWKSCGGRMFQDDMLWFTLNGDGSVTVRNKYNETKGRAEINIP